jgi:hypothetical protein
VSLPEDFKARLKSRLAVGEAVASEYNLTKTPIFTRDETAALTRAADAGGDSLLGVADALTSAGGDKALDVLGEVSKDAPILANIGALKTVGGDTAIVRDAAAGLELMALDGFKSRLPHIEGRKQVLQEAYGNAFSVLSTQYQAASQTAFAAYEAEAFRLGVQPSAYADGEEKTRLERRLQEAVGASYDGKRRYGGTADVRGHKVVAPRWLNHARVDDVLDVMTDADWSKVGRHGGPKDADGKPLSAADLKGSYLQSVGDGVYRVYFSDPYDVSPEYVYSGHAADPVFTLDMNRLEGQLRTNKSTSRWVMGGR